MINNVIKLLNKFINNPQGITVSKFCDNTYHVKFQYNNKPCSFHILSDSVLFYHGSNHVNIDMSGNKKYEILFIVETIYNKIQEETFNFLKEIANDW